MKICVIRVSSLMNLGHADIADYADFSFLQYSYIYHGQEYLRHLRNLRD